MKVRIELNNQEVDIVLGGLERLKEQLIAQGYTAEVVPVQSLLTRIIDTIEQEEDGHACCGGCK